MGDFMNCGIEVLKRLSEILNIDLNDVILNCESKVNEFGLSLYDLKYELNKVIPTKAIIMRAIAIDCLIALKLKT